ncbi:MAG: hypothetical protein OHK0039_05440 [Bacteroidia bacterium]
MATDHKLPAHMKWETLVSEVAAAMNDTTAFHYLDREIEEVVVIADDIDYQEPVLLREATGEAFVADEWSLDEDRTVHPLMHAECPDHIVPIHRDKTANVLRLIRRFVADKVQDPQTAEALLLAIEEPHPLRAFRKELTYHAGLRTLWHDFQSEHYRHQAAEWLHQQGIYDQQTPARHTP